MYSATTSPRSSLFMIASIDVRACLPMILGNAKPRDPWVLPIATKNHVSCGSVGVWGGILTRFQSRFALGSLGENTQPHK